MTLADLKGRTVVASLKGSTQAAWLEAKLPDVEVLRLNSVSDALQALKQRRAVGVAVDKATIMVVATRDPELKLLGHPLRHHRGRHRRAEEREGVAGVPDRVPGPHEAPRSMYVPWIEKWVPADRQPRAVRGRSFMTTPQLEQ